MLGIFTNILFPLDKYMLFISLKFIFHFSWKCWQFYTISLVLPYWHILFRMNLTSINSKSFYQETAIFKNWIVTKCRHVQTICPLIVPVFTHRPQHCIDRIILLAVTNTDPISLLYITGCPSLPLNYAVSLSCRMRVTCINQLSQLFISYNYLF